MRPRECTDDTFLPVDGIYGKNHYNNPPITIHNTHTPTPHIYDKTAKSSRVTGILIIQRYIISPAQSRSHKTSTPLLPPPNFRDIVASTVPFFLSVWVGTSPPRGTSCAPAIVKGIKLSIVCRCRRRRTISFKVTDPMWRTDGTGWMIAKASREETCLFRTVYSYGWMVETPPPPFFFCSFFQTPQRWRLPGNGSVPPIVTLSACSGVDRLLCRIKSLVGRDGNMEIWDELQSRIIMKEVYGFGGWKNKQRCRGNEGRLMSP